VLDTARSPGTKLVDAVPLVDFVFEIDNKSINHRPDLWGHYGFARELAAIYGKSSSPSRPGSASFEPVPRRPGGRCSIAIQDRRRARATSGRCSTASRIGPSPTGMKRLLRAIGLRPINNVVDATNFVMLEIGQPLHAFDAHQAGPGRDRRAARARGRDDQDARRAGAEAGPEDLLITSGGRAVAIAGVMGGEDSGVTAGTTSLFLESATFHATSIRRTSTRLGCAPTRAPATRNRSTRPWPSRVRIGSSRSSPRSARRRGPAGPLVDAGGWRYAGRRLTLRKKRLETKLGKSADRPEVAKIFTSLRFGVKVREDAFEIDVPRSARPRTSSAKTT
jgi:phenylalanyl-tRNA synthetase beta chain